MRTYNSAPLNGQASLSIISAFCRQDSQTKSRYPVTSRKSSFVGSRSKSFSSFDHPLDEISAMAATNTLPQESLMNLTQHRRGHSFSENRSSLSDSVLSGLFHTERTGETFQHYFGNSNKKSR